MKKIAIFVEGLTEQIFLTEFIKQIFGTRNITFNLFKYSGKAGSRSIQIIEKNSANEQDKIGMYIYDSAGDESVKSDIKNNLHFLQKSGFSKVLGIRDVYPNTYTDINKIRRLMMYGMPTSLVPLSIHLSIMEIESWFLAEENHYRNINTSFTMEEINNVLGIDITSQSTETIENPATMLDEIYKVKGMRYEKNRNKKIVKDKAKIERTVNALDFENLYFNVRQRNGSLNEFLIELDSSLFSWKET